MKCCDLYNLLMGMHLTTILFHGTWWCQQGNLLNHLAVCPFWFCGHPIILWSLDRFSSILTCADQKSGNCLFALQSYTPFNKLPQNSIKIFRSANIIFTFGKIFIKLWIRQPDDMQRTRRINSVFQHVLCLSVLWSYCPCFNFHMIFDIFEKVMILFLA